MKKLAILFTGICICFTIHATEYLKKGNRITFTFDLSPKASFGNAIFLNSNVDADPYANRFFFSPTWFVGGRAGLTTMSSVPRYVMFTVYGEYMTGSISQKYELRDYDQSTPVNYSHTYSMNANSMALMLRATVFSGPEHESAMYFEIGKQNNILSNFKETNSINPTDLYSNVLPGYTPASRFNTNLGNVVFGIGAHGFMYSLGLRCTYGLNNIMHSSYNPVDDGHYNNTLTNVDYTKYNYTSDYKETRLLSVQLVLEINLYLLELGNATCGKKRFFPFPFHLNNIVVW